jgi:hypothetical protein
LISHWVYNLQRSNGAGLAIAAPTALPNFPEFGAFT